MKYFSKLSLIALPLSLFSFISCNNNPTITENAYYTSVKRIAPFLHEITYDDYADDPEHRTTDIDGEFKFDFGCASIRNGNIYGRNYDYYFSNSPTFLVRVRKNEKHFQSIGLANSLAIEDQDVIDMEKAGGYHEDFSIIPNFTLDGINENGVIANMNVVDFEDGGSPASTTNPGKPQLYLYSSVRYILDHALNADHAISLLNNCDIYTLNHHANNIHLMIADPFKTYIVEFIKEEGNDNVTLRAEQKRNDEQIMTNFYNNMTQEEINKTYKEMRIPLNPVYNLNAHGVERYQYIKDRYRFCTDVDTVATILQNMRYSNMYLDPFVPEFPSEDFTQTEIFLGDFDGYNDIYGITRDVLKNNRRDVGRESDVWITMHTSIYDIENKTLRLNVQENYERTYNYDLNF